MNVDLHSIFYHFVFDLSTFQGEIDFCSILLPRIAIEGGKRMVGERLLDLRKDAGLTQDELAEILNINKHSISSYERDKSEAPDAIKMAIAKYFNVTIDYLVGLTDNPGTPTTQANVLRLPANLPKQAIPELKSFIEFLTYKYSDKH